MLNGIVIAVLWMTELINYLWLHIRFSAHPPVYRCCQFSSPVRLSAVRSVGKLRETASEATAAALFYFRLAAAALFYFRLSDNEPGRASLPRAGLSLCEVLSERSCEVGTERQPHFRL